MPEMGEQPLASLMRCVHGDVKHSMGTNIFKDHSYRSVRKTMFDLPSILSRSPQMLTHISILFGLNLHDYMHLVLNDTV